MFFVVVILQYYKIKQILYFNILLVFFYFTVKYYTNITYFNNNIYILFYSHIDCNINTYFYFQFLFYSKIFIK